MVSYLAWRDTRFTHNKIWVYANGGLDRTYEVRKLKLAQFVLRSRSISPSSALGRIGNGHKEGSGHWERWRHKRHDNRNGTDNEQRSRRCCSGSFFFFEITIQFNLANFAKKSPSSYLVWRMTFVWTDSCDANHKTDQRNCRRRCLLSRLYTYLEMMVWL